MAPCARQDSTSLTSNEPVHAKNGVREQEVLFVAYLQQSVDAINI